LTRDLSADVAARFAAADAKRAHHRGIVDPAADGTISLTDFHARFEVWALFESWKDVPSGIRTTLNEWEPDSHEERIGVCSTGCPADDIVLDPSPGCGHAA